jgi:hypothetical protein
MSFFPDCPVALISSLRFGLFFRYHNGKAYRSMWSNCRLCQRKRVCMSIYSIFPHYLINGTIFEGKKQLRSTKYVLISLQLLFARFLVLRKNERDTIKKCIFVFMWSAHYCCSILMTLEFCQKVFKKIVKYQISWKSIHWETSCSTWTRDELFHVDKRRTDWQTWRI